MKYDYGKYTMEEVKDYTNEWFKDIDNVINTDYQTNWFINVIIGTVKAKHEKDFKNSSVLDWGCATGISLVKLKKFCGHDNVYGIDISETAVNMGK